MSSCTLTTLSKPCPSCPWRVNRDATDIPDFDLSLAEGLVNCCPGTRNMGPDFGASMFACHQSKDGAEVACAGWMATVGHRLLACAWRSLWAVWTHLPCALEPVGRICIQTTSRCWKNSGQLIRPTN